MSEKLKEITIETSSFCNQGCVYCPATHLRRAKQEMPIALFRRIAGEAAEYSPCRVYLHGYNEPSLDESLPEKIACLKKKKLRTIISSNGSGLSLGFVKRLEAAGLSCITVNLPSLDRGYYRKVRQVDDFPEILHNLARLKNKRLFSDITVLGKLDKGHQTNASAIMREFPRQRVSLFPVIDRAAAIAGEFANNIRHPELGGCLENRIRDSVYIDCQGRVWICCQDYREKYVVGDLNKESLKDILNSQRRAGYLDQSNGKASSGKDFICKSCSLALPRGKSKKAYLKEVFCQSCRIDRVLCRNCVVGINLESFPKKIIRKLKGHYLK